MSSKRFLAAIAAMAIMAQTPVHARDLLVGAASSLTNAFTELAVQFQQHHPGAKVLMSFASSDTLAQQVVQGAPIDVFASADEKAMDDAAADQSIDAASRRYFASNEVVLVTPADNPLGIRSAADLKSSGAQRIALGNPATVPVGRYTKTALEQLAAWDFVKQNEVLGQNARQVLDYVARGEVDAGFVFASDAAAMPDKVKVIGTLKSPVVAQYPIALVKRDGPHPLAGQFVDFVVSPAGQATLAKYGFGRP